MMPAGDKITELRHRIDQLEVELHELRERANAPCEPRFGRRHLIAAAGGAIAGGVLGSAAPAGADNGDALILGSQANTATNITRVTGAPFQVEAGTGTAFSVEGSDPESFIASIGGAARGLVVSGSQQALFAFTDGADGLTAFVGSEQSDALTVQAGANGRPDPGRRTSITATTPHPEVMPLALEGGRAHALLDPRADAGAPSTLLHDAGEVALDANAEVHVCNTTGTPGTWHRLLTNRAPAATGTGAITVLDRPFRLYDSRPGTSSVLPGPKTPLTPGAPRSLDVAGQGSPAVPDGAVAVVATVGVVNTGGQGILRGYATGSAFPNQSLLYWSAANQRVATTTIIRLRTAGAITLATFTTPTDVTVDVVGWIA
jgi:hypothetical protein